MIEFSPTGISGHAGYLRLDDLDIYELTEERPRTRGECENGPRPCPWVSCKFHLYLDVDPYTGILKIRFPEIEPGEMKESCALDVADGGDHTLDELSEVMGLTRERIRQVEVGALLKFRLAAPADINDD